MSKAANPSPSSEPPLVKPVFTWQPGVYRFVWQDYGISILVDRIREHGETFSGEFTIERLEGNPEPHLYLTRIGLLSNREKEGLINTMMGWGDETIRKLPWGNLIEYACLHTARKYREGEPMIDVGNLPVVRKGRWRLYPFLLDTELNMIFGVGGSLKSTLASMIGTQVRSGKKALGLNPIQGQVIYLDYETRSDEINKKVAETCACLGIVPAVTLKYQKCEQPLADIIESIQRKVLENDAKLIILDSLGYACGGEPESAEVVMRCFMALRSLNITVLCIDHTNKSGVLFGSIYKYNGMRNIWEAKVASELGSPTIAVGLYHEKINTGRRLPPLGYRFTFNAADVLEKIEEVKPKDIPELPTGETDVQRMIDLLKRGALSVEDIAEELNIPKSSVRTITTRNKKVFTKVSGGKSPKWGLLQSESATSATGLKGHGCST